MNYDINQYDERTFKNMSFDILELGQEFYARKPRLTAQGVDDTEPMKKVLSFKNSKGQWINSKSKLGYEAYIPNDKKVLVLVK